MTSPPAQATEKTQAYYFSARLRGTLAGMLQSPLTVVEAPMGYGKTVAVKEFLRKAPVRTIVTTAVQSSPQSFWPDFCDNLAHGIPKAEKVSAALARLGFPYDSVKAGAARRLLRRLAPEKHTVLVFDDCHFLPPSFIAFCESLAQENVPGMRLVYITRNAWEGSKALLRLKNFLTYMDRNVLALVPSEICEYYASCGVPLSLEKARELHASTEGWITALYLFLTRHKLEGAASAFLKKSAKATSTPINTLLEEAVYAPLSAEAKELLFVLTPMERFTAAQATKLHGKDVTALLKELISKNAFVVFDPEARVYSVHAIFRQLLLNIFEKDGILTQERRRDIYRACGDAFMDADEFASAIQAWHKGGDFEHALAVLEKDMSRHLVTESAALYTAMFKDCPEEMLQRHIGAAFKYAIAAFSIADFPAFGEQLAWLTKQCAALPPGQEADDWRGELEFLHSLAAFNDIEAMSRRHRRANYLLGRPTRLFGQNSSWTLGNPSVLFMFYRESGKLGEALRHMHDCLPHYYQLASHHGAGGEFLMEAEALYNAGRFAEAEILCHRAEAMASHHAQLGNVLCAVFLRMRLALTAGEAERAQGLVTAMRALIAKSRDYFLLHTVDMCEGWLYAVLGQPEKMPAWLRSELAEDSRLYAFARGWYYVVHGRALLLGGEYARVLGLFGYLLEKGLFAKHLLFSIYAHIYLAAAHQGLGKAAPAVEDLKNALDSALPDEVYMPFAENCDLLAPVFRARLHGKPDKRLKALLTLAKQAEAGSRTMAGKTSHQERCGLTRREYETALLMAEDLPSEEIARRLHISLNTVKFHLKNVYRKSGASSRLALKKMLES